MSFPLRQSTAGQEVPLGYFLDSTDGNTEETALTIANTDIKLHKSGATTLANKNSGGATHISNGIYYAVLDATDSNTLGDMTIFCHVSGALAVKVNCIVYPANAYDALFLGTGVGVRANVEGFGGSAGTFASGRPDVNTTYIAGSAVNTTLAQIGVNVVNFGGSAGTFAAGRPEANTTHWNGTAVTTPPAVNCTQISGDSTAADNAESFFDGTGYAGTNNVIPTVTAVTNQVTANMTAISGDSVAADNLESYCDGTTPQPVNVTTWLGTAAATPTTAGVPEVDVTHISGAAVSTTTAQVGANIVQVIGDPITASSSKTTNWGGTP